MWHRDHCGVVRILLVLLLAALLALPGRAQAAPRLQQVDDPAPPEQGVKLIFIHHSTGENWLRDDYGGLGRALAENNYFVSDTNYGWGPDSIGDRTDIPDWTEWFASDQTPVYVDALFGESGQNSGYTRLFDDPGGENQIVLFKSCFPNSALEGSPGDPPDPDGWLTVGHAKYVYNEILGYFATRPDKLFVVITAPPLSDSSYADNARAFNNWLVEDWLAENGYTQPNVAVFDFYNVLSGGDAHHWFQEGRVERVLGGRNTLAYPSGDDHPSERGSRKATEEFVPLLNVFYNRWAASAPGEPSSGDGDSQAAPTAGPDLQTAPSQLIADFETVGLSGWVFYRDETTPSQITCGLQNDSARLGSAALQIDFDIPPGTWSTCELPYDQAQDWSVGQGLGLYIQGSRADIPYNLLVFSGTADSRATYLVYTRTPAGSDGDWVYVEYPWSAFARAEWEADGGTPFQTPDQVLAIAFGFDGLESENNTGTVWVDEISLLRTPTAPEVPAQAEEEGTGWRFPCPGGLILPLVFVGLVWAGRKRR